MEGAKRLKAFAYTYYVLSFWFLFKSLHLKKWFSAVVWAGLARIVKELILTLHYILQSC